jgi:hypothetical protein
MKLLLGIGAVILSGVLFSCNSSDKNGPVKTAPVKSAPPAPFHFIRKLPVVPGLTFDVVSWGRGTESGGAYMILRSDSTHLNYRSVTGELDGKIVDAWNTDMDADGNPEVFIQSKGSGEGSYLNMYVYEFNSSGSAQQIRFPDLSSATKKSYRGMDTLYLKDGKLMRGFPLFKEEDQTSKPTAGKKLIEYDLRGNSFSVREILDRPAK